MTLGCDTVREFQEGQTVLVYTVIPRPHRDPVAIEPTYGRVTRTLSRDNSAWIRLNSRVAPELHPFPEDDESGRGNHVLAWPSDCDLVKP